MPPKDQSEATDSSTDANASPGDQARFAYPQPFVSKKLREMSDDFVEEYRSGPTGPGEVGGFDGQRTHAHKEPSGDE